MNSICFFSSIIHTLRLIFPIKSIIDLTTRKLIVDNFEIINYWCKKMLIPFHVFLVFGRRVKRYVSFPKRLFLQQDMCALSQYSSTVPNAKQPSQECFLTMEIVNQVTFLILVALRFTWHESVKAIRIKSNHTISLQKNWYLAVFIPIKHFILSSAKLFTKLLSDSTDKSNWSVQ